MILTCPSCGTRYNLTEAQLGPAGRKVRCTACKTTWHAEAPPAEPIELAPEPVVKPRVEDLQKVKAEKLPSRYRALLQDKKRLKTLSAQGLVWAGLVGAFIAVLAVAYAMRVDVVRAFPRIAGAYAMVGVKVNATHLEFGDKSADAAVKGGRFFVTVKAQIKNISDKSVPVPPVRVKLMDASLQTFSSVLIPSSGLNVPPHQVRTLTFDVADPKNMTASIDLDFDLEAMKAAARMAKLRPSSVHAVAEKVTEAEPSDAPSPTESHAPAAGTETPVKDAAASDNDSPPSSPSDHQPPPLRSALTSETAHPASAGVSH